MHDKPEILELICIDALCHNVIAFCTQKFPTSNLSIFPETENVNDPTLLLEFGQKIPNSTNPPISELSSPSSNDFSPSEPADAIFLNDPHLQKINDDGIAKKIDFLPKNANLDQIARFAAISLSSPLSNKLLCRLNDTNQLNDKTLKFFDNQKTKLTQVFIKNSTLRANQPKSTGADGVRISHDGLSVLKQHSIDSLHLENLAGLKIERLVQENLNPSSVENLKILNLSGTLKIKHFTRCCSFSTLKNSPPTPDPLASPIVKMPGNSAFLCKFANLQTLIVARTNFDDSTLTDICDHLTRLTYLDISHTNVTDLQPLVKLRETLTVLLVQKPRFGSVEPAVTVLANLDGLTVLDLSGYPAKSASTIEDGTGSMPVSLAVALIRRLAEGVGRLEKLRVLDISGGQANFDVNVFSSFLNTHERLEFFGLLMSNACYFCCILARTDMKVSGEADKKQVFTALETYWSRDYFCSRSFYLLFRMLEMDFSTFTQEDKEFCLKHIISGLNFNLYQLNVQMAGTACLYNLCREERAKTLHPAHLRAIVDCSLRALEIHAKTLQLHKNVWLTLCNDHILQSGTFDMFRCCLVALESMVNCNEAQVTRITVAIVSILAAKIPTEWTARLGANRTYMKFLLQIVNQKNDAHSMWLAEHPTNQQNPNVVAPLPDMTLKFTLSALWNLTDESPATCLTFLEENGLDVVLRVLELFQDHTIEAKVLGLLNNVAEVGHLKAHLVNQTALATIKRLLLCNKIEVSYFSAGILAHLCADLSWDHFQPSWDDCLELLSSTVHSWEKPEVEMVAYRSFKPFFSLLEKVDIPAVQFWALWAIHHVCSNNRERYVDMFKDQHGKEALEKVRDTTMLKHPYIFLLCNSILELLT